MGQALGLRPGVLFKENGMAECGGDRLLEATAVMVKKVKLSSIEGIDELAGAYGAGYGPIRLIAGQSFRLDHVCDSGGNRRVPIQLVTLLCSKPEGGIFMSPGPVGM